MMIEIDLLLACGATFRKLAKGETVFSEGCACNFYYQLVNGRVRWANVDEEGKDFIQVFVDPGESFGELPLFDGEPYAASAIADEDSLVIRLHKSTFHQLIRENQQLHLAFTQLLARRLRFKFMLLKSLASHDPEKRIHTLLQYLKKEKKNFCVNCNQLKLTRQQIADMTGLRVETVIRSMRNMHDQGKLQINRGKVFC